MRNAVASLFMSLDGVTESPETWHFPYFNDEMGAAVGAGMASADAFLLGRRTYQEWAQYWPTADNPMAGAMNAMKEIAISGSATLVCSLIDEQLLDELRLLIHPVVLGNGGRLFDGASARTSLELVDSQTFSTGVLNLTYRPAG